ncbi:FAD-dependent oxidoreductase [Asaia sp. W19]|uniref:NAD(P)/FAD-dependent oxidoreductase n=1 Tax=unclassified Asaia TaxID=2685023 RepID=UPI000F8CFA2E|nr:FAD-dependent oxidoreductase [Asaia sp. W19]RUT24832.1 FAD-dependent oxidoreductase [Asaia sp. W19]
MSVTIGTAPERYDTVVIGAGVMGATTALFLAQAGMKVALVDRGVLFRAASGINAGTLTLHMTRAQLIPHAIRGREMWLDAERWLGEPVGAVSTHGLSLAFTEAEEALLRARAHVRSEAGAPIDVISARKALEIEPGLNPGLRAAASCALDGHIPSYRVGAAYARALKRGGVTLLEHSEVERIVTGDGSDHAIYLRERAHPVRAGRIVASGGAWLEKMLRWMGFPIPIRCLFNQLVVTEPMSKVMGSVISIANGLLSLKQFTNGSVLIGGGWQGEGTLEAGGTRVIPENLRGNVRLAQHVIPALRNAMVLRVWLGQEAETPDAMPLIGALGTDDSRFVIGSVHSGFTSGPYMARLLADRILGGAPDLRAFDPCRFTPPPPTKAGSLPPQSLLTGSS